MRYMVTAKNDAAGLVDELVKRCINTAQWVIETDVEELLDSVLVVEQCRIWLGDDFETVRYRFTVTYGGPNISFDTYGVFKATWGPDSVEVVIHDEKLINKLHEIFGYLEEVFGSDRC